MDNIKNDRGQRQSREQTVHRPADVHTANTLHYTHPFKCPSSGTTRVSRYQKGITNLDFTEAGDSEWQWHQLGRMQVCTSLQTDNHAILLLHYTCLTALCLGLPG